MTVKTGEIFIIDYIKSNDSITRKYFKSDGDKWNGKLVTEEFIME